MTRLAGDGGVAFSRGNRMARALRAGALVPLVALVVACGGDGDDRTEKASSREAIETTTTRRATTTSSTTTTTTAPAEAFMHQWSSQNGYEYGVGIFFGEPDPSGSPGGCIQSPPPGRTNIRFAVNLASFDLDREAPIPDVAFGANLTADGSEVDPSIVTIERAYDTVEVTPTGPDTPCFLAFSIHGDLAGRERLGVGIPNTYVGTIGNVPDPVPAGLQLIVRVFNSSGQAENLTVPFREIHLGV